MSRWLRSPLVRLAWQLPIVIVMILGIVLVPAYREAVRDIQDQVHSAINEQILGLTQVYQDEGLQGLIDEVNARTDDNVDGPAVYLLADAEGVRIAGAAMNWPAEVKLRNNQWFSIPQSRGDTLDGKMFVMRDNSRLLVARRSPLKLFRSHLSTSLMLATALAFAGSMLLAAFSLGRYRRRLARIQTAARDILLGDLSQRITVDGHHDELDELAGEFNQAFAEIEKLMEATRHVSSAIAHDMRRPIAAIRYRLDELHRRDDLPAAMHSTIQALLEQTDESLNTFAALLRLARLESGSYGPKKEPLTLQTLLQDVQDTYAPVAAAHDMRFDTQLCGEPLTIMGDSNLLFQGLQNIIDNAINYGAEQIDLQLTRADTQACITIRDYGPGVSELALPHLFERFYRADTARTSGGSGIGLALVRAIVDVHGGTVSAYNATPGLAVVLKLPIVQPWPTDSMA